MTIAASLGIDTCPMEGFEKDKMEAILEIDASEFQVAVLVALGYRAGDQTPRRRHDRERLVDLD